MGKVCCLCGNPEIHTQESRPTGKIGKMQEWPFCLNCWDTLQRQRAERHPEIALRYSIFLRYVIVGGMDRGWNDHEYQTMRGGEIVDLGPF